MKVNFKLNIEGLKFVVPTNADVNLDKFDFDINEEMTDAEFIGMVKGFKDLIETYIHKTPITSDERAVFSTAPKPYIAKTFDNSNLQIKQDLADKIKDTAKKPDIDAVKIGDELWHKIVEEIEGWRKDLKDPAMYDISEEFPTITISNKSSGVTEEIRIIRQDDCSVGCKKSSQLDLKYNYNNADLKSNHFSSHIGIYPNLKEISRFKSDDSCYYEGRIKDFNLRDLIKRLVNIMDEVSI